MNKMIQLTITHLKKYNREKSVKLGIFVFPIVFIGVFGIAFQYGAPGTTSIPIGVVIYDNGIPTNTIVLGENTTVSNNYFSDQFIDIIESVTFEDNETNIFIPHYIDEKQARDKIDHRELMALLIIPADFSLGIMSSIRNNFPELSALTNDFANYPANDYKTNITIVGDQSLQDFAIAFSVLQSITNAYFNMGEELSLGNNLMLENALDTEGLTAFDYVLPGLVVYAILLNLTAVAQFSLRDVENGVLDRLRVSRITGTDYTNSIILSQLIISMIQIPIMFLVGIIMGFEMKIQIIYSFIFAAIISLSVTGIGLIIASLVKNADAAGSVSNMVATPMGFLSSAFFLVPNPIVLELWGNSIKLFDFLPSSTAIDSLRLLLLAEYPLEELWFQLVLSSILAIVYLLIGVKLYTKKHLRPH